MRITFPGESAEYRAARNRLLEREIELRRAMEAVAVERRADGRAAIHDRLDVQRSPLWYTTGWSTAERASNACERGTPRT